MSRWNLNGRRVNSDVFVMFNDKYARPFNFRGINFFGTGANCILGPDIARRTLSNPPSRKVPGFNAPWPAPSPRRPGFPFNRDANLRWVQGHLINDNWGGSGANLCNLTPLTNEANSWHKSVETIVKNFLEFSYIYEMRSFRDHFYGVEYFVSRSRESMQDYRGAHPGAQLYNYAPSFIKVTWRAIRMRKRSNLNTIQQVIIDAIRHKQSVTAGQINDVLRFGTRARIQFKHHHGQTNGPTYYQPNFAIQPNGFDGTYEVHNRRR